MNTGARWTTYELCRDIITADKKAGLVDEAYKADMMKKLDVFLLGNRITVDEYNELVELLNS